MALNCVSIGTLTASLVHPRYTASDGEGDALSIDVESIAERVLAL